MSRMKVYNLATATWEYMAAVAPVSVGPSAPLSPVDGQLWWDNDDTSLIPSTLDPNTLAVNAAFSSRYLSSTRRGVKVRRATDQVIPTGTTTGIAFSVADYQSDTYWVIGNPGRLVVPAGLGGVYVIRSHFRGDATGMPASTVLMISVNGVPIDRTVATGAIIYSAHHLTTIGVLAAGDYVEMFVTQGSGANRTVSALITGSGTDPQSPILEMYRFSL